MYRSARLHRWVAVVMTVAACNGKPDTVASRGSVVGAAPRVVVSEIMANPRTVPDERGEWIELHNLERTPVDVRGWTIASQNDRGAAIDRAVVIPPGAFTVLSRDGDRAENGGVAAGFAYGDAVALGNGADWIALRTSDGRTVDSVAWTSALAGASRALRDPNVPHTDVLGPAWTTSTSAYGRGDLGTPGRANGASGSDVVARERFADTTSGNTRDVPSTPPGDSTLVIRVLDVGQGDAILVENGGSRVLIDGGPEPGRLGRLLDAFGVRGATLDALIITHQHYDHYAGLREVFRSSRRIAVRYVFENMDPYSNVSLARLRDSIIAHAKRGALAYRDTDDPCGNGSPTCTITLRGSAKLEILRPDPNGDGPNNRSVALRLTGPGASTFSMWLAGDAEQQEIAWFDATDYDRSPGMQATVLKGDHHGSCDGVSPRYLDLVRPEVAILSLAAQNDYGYVHAQTLDLLQHRRIPWYRTDQNGTVTITVPPAGAYRVSAERGGPNSRGPSDRPARSCGEDDPPGRR